MCTGACSRFIAIPLYILALVSVICNIMLFFPDFDTQFAKADKEGNARITDEVKYMGGLIGGGIMVSRPVQTTVAVRPVLCVRHNTSMAAGGGRDEVLAQSTRTPAFTLSVLIRDLSSEIRDPNLTDPNKSTSPRFPSCMMGL
uniref:Uncharacterized protein n=1 Tax=Nothobranchius rachovii TaxID=451742 RepID=A0A1A8NHD7_9TELE